MTHHDKARELVERLREALEHIDRHMSLITGKTSMIGTTQRIARAAMSRTGEK